MHDSGETRDLVNEEKLKSKPGYVPSGVLKVANIEITEEITFLDYIRNGTQMHFAVAIDFTASNKPPSDPKSLHHLSDDHMNSYEIALRGIGDIIQQYDNSGLFPAFGKFYFDIFFISVQLVKMSFLFVWQALAPKHHQTIKFRFSSL